MPFNVFKVFDVFDVYKSSFMHAAGSKTNTCVTNAGTDGTWYFYDMGAGFGVAVPNVANDDTEFYALKCNVTGNWRCEWGADGTTKLADVEEILITDKISTSIAIWNTTEQCYIFNDLAKATEVIDAINGAGLPETCFFIGALLNGEVVRYGFELERGTA
jgi:hypothetical protein